MAILNLKITATANDTGVTGGSLDLGDTRVSSTVYGALRFLNVTIPSGATITSATLRLHAEGGAHTIVGTVKGVLGNCPAWSTSPLPGALSQTSASTSLPTSTSVAWVERDVTAIVQEIVNGIWSSGNALGVILGYTSGTGTAFYTDYTVTSADAAELIIDYATPPAITIATSVQNLHNTKLSIPFTVDQTVDRALGGPDYLDFELSGDTIRWVGDGVSNFDSPADDGTNNVYNVTLTVNNTTTGLSASTDITVTVQKIIYVGGQTYGRAGATGTATQNFVLTNGTNSAPQAGDLVIIVQHVGGTSDLTLALTSGYTKAIEGYTDGTSYDSNLAVFYKFMSGTPDTNFVVGSSGSANNAQNCYISVWRGIDPTTPFDIIPTLTQFTGTQKPDPPSITPTVNGAVILMAAGAAAATTANWTAPSYLTYFRTISTADTVDSVVGGGYRRWLTADGAYNGAVWAGGGTANAANASMFVHMVLRPASGSSGTELPVGRADEANIAYALPRVQNRAAGRSNEADSALAPAAQQRRAVGLATETDVAYALPRVQSRAAGRADETDTAYALPQGSVSMPVGLAVEADTAYALPRVQSRPTARADEADTAYAPSHTQRRAVARSDETDTAYALPRQERRATGRADEVDTAYALSQGAVSLPVGRADEADTAYALSHTQRRAAARSDEADSALAPTLQQRRPVGLAVETDAAFALTHRQVRTVGRADEIDTAFALGSGSSRPYGLSVEVDTALALGRQQRRIVGRADEVDTAFALLAGGTALPVGRATETDTAYAPVSFQRRAVGLAVETDGAFALPRVQRRPVARAGEYDEALAPPVILTRPVGVSEETDTSLALVTIQRLAVGRADEVDTAYQMLSARVVVPDSRSVAENRYSISVIEPRRTASVAEPRITISLAEDRTSVSMREPRGSASLPESRRTGDG